MIQKTNTEPQIEHPNKKSTQPVIFTLAFYVVQWEANPLIKMLIITVGSCLIALGLSELLVKRVRAVRALFGMRIKL